MKIVPVPQVFSMSYCHCHTTPAAKSCCTVICSPTENVLATAFVKSLATESPMPREKTLIDREMLRETEKPDSDVEAEDRVTTEPCVRPAVWA